MFSTRVPAILGLPIFDHHSQEAGDVAVDTRDPKPRLASFRRPGSLVFRTQPGVVSAYRWTAGPRYLVFFEEKLKPMSGF